MPAPLYFVEHQGKHVRGKWFIELDRDSNSRAAVIEMIRSGEVDAVKVLEIDEEANSCRDVTEEFKHCAKWGDHVQAAE